MLVDAAQKLRVTRLIPAKNDSPRSYVQLPKRETMEHFSVGMGFMDH